SSSLITSLKLQNFLTECREYQLDGEQGRSVFAIENGIDLNNIHRDHTLALVHHLHSEMGFSVAKPTTNGSSYSWCFVWVERIHADVEMDRGVACSSDLDGLLNYPGDVISVDIRHSKDMNMLSA